MKLLVFAHTPPPHHGQSYMVQLMLAGLGGDARRRPEGEPAPEIECYHVNARFSRGLEDVGTFQGTKILLIFWFCMQALWLRFRYDVPNLYYVPAPGKRVALYRDWLVMFMCRPFFDHIILHWHAAGLAKWLETANDINTRALTYRAFRPVDMSIVLSRYNLADAEKLLSRSIRVVNNGVDDPCPDFAINILPRRLDALAIRKQILAGEVPKESVIVNVLYIAHCAREKGVFCAAESVVRVNSELAARRLPMQLKLIAAGNFVNEEEKAEFHNLLEDPAYATAVSLAGFISGETKTRLLREADLFLFPTQYLGENQPVNLIEAMAFGLPLVTTRWRSLPEMLPENYSGLVSGQYPAEVAAAILKVLEEKSGERLRQHFLQNFTLKCHIKNLAAAIRSVEE